MVHILNSNGIVIGCFSRIGMEAGEQVGISVITVIEIYGRSRDVGAA